MRFHDFLLLENESEGLSPLMIIGTVAGRICEVFDPVDDEPGLRSFLRALTPVYRAVVSHYAVAPYIFSAGLDNTRAVSNEQQANQPSGGLWWSANAWWDQKIKPPWK